MSYKFSAVTVPHNPEKCSSPSCPLRLMWGTGEACAVPRGWWGYQIEEAQTSSPQAKAAHQDLIGCDAGRG